MLFFAAVFLAGAFFVLVAFAAFLAGALFAAGSSSPSSLALLSPRADCAACTERCKAASRSTTSPEDFVEVGVRLISPPSILAFTSASTAPA